LTSLCRTWRDGITVQTFGTAPKRKKNTVAGVMPTEVLDSNQPKISPVRFRSHKWRDPCTNPTNRKLPFLL